jgi:hypothetical protein
VLTAGQAISAQIEANADKFHFKEYLPLLVAVRERIARFIGAQTEDCVLVPNTSHGIYTVLQNFEWNAGDVLVASAIFLDILVKLTRRYDRKQIISHTEAYPKLWIILPIDIHTRQFPSSP